MRIFQILQYPVFIFQERKEGEMYPSALIAMGYSPVYKRQGDMFRDFFILFEWPFSYQKRKVNWNFSAGERMYKCKKVFRLNFQFSYYDGIR